MQEITPSVDTDAVLERIGVGRNEELRNSNRRRRYLEKLSRVITPERPTVRLDGSVPTAYVDQEKNKPAIAITTREFDQPSTDLSRDVYDMTVQEALLIHEVGHVLYTDHATFQRTLSRVDLQYKGAYKRLWNCLEDGAIEEQLRRKFNVENELFVANSNLRGGGTGDEKKTVDLYGAVTVACMDLAVHDAGRLGELRDPDDDSIQFRSPVERELFEGLMPEIKSVTSDVLTTADAVERTERIYDFWVEVRDKLNEAEQEGQDQEDAKNTQSQENGDDDQQEGGETLGDLFGPSDGDESDESDDGQEGGGGVAVMPIPKPDDSENANLGGADDADELERADEEDIEDAIDDAADPDEDTEGQSPGAGAGDEEDGDEETEGSGSDGDGPDEDEIEEQRRGQLREEANEVDGVSELMEEVEEYGDILTDMAGDYRGEVKVKIPGEKEVDSFDRWQKAQRRSRKIAQLLRQSLREERRSRRVKNERRGRFDRGRMVAAERGSARVFEREEEGDEKDYDCMMVLDRSGSMSGERITLAEDAVTALSLALEEVGVGVSLLGMLSNDAWLENSFGRDVENDRGKMLSNDYGGGTPLAKTLRLARKRMEKKADSDNRFMIVVTDGKPGDEDAYKVQLDKCTFPVLGVYVDTDEDDAELFHRQVKTTQSDIDEAITRLARQAMI